MRFAGEAARGLPGLLLAALAAAAALYGCGGSAPSGPPAAGIPRALLEQARPIGRGSAFHPPATGPVLGRCDPILAPRIAAHLEVFAANRVVIVAAGIGTRKPWTLTGGHIAQARCYGALVTLDPTGVVLVRPHAHLSVRELFRAWGEPLGPSRLASFSASAGSHVAAYVDGRRWQGSPGAIPLTSHAEIVLEVGPYVPPHTSYTFPPES